MQTFFCGDGALSPFPHSRNQASCCSGSCCDCLLIDNVRPRVRGLKATTSSTHGAKTWLPPLPCFPPAHPYHLGWVSPLLDRVGW